MPNPVTPYRRTQRAPLETFANRVLGDEVYLCQTRDISTDSLRLRRVLEPQRAFRRMQLEFALPGSDEIIWAHGEVVREPRGENVVVRFLAMADRHRRLIDGYVRQTRRARRRAARAR
jgi:hypothetical protein